MKSLLKYSVLSLGAILCATSLTSCPGARATSKALGRTSGTTARTMMRTENPYVRLGGDLAGAYVDYRLNDSGNPRNNYTNSYGSPYYAGGGFGNPYYPNSYSNTYYNSGYGY